MKNTTLPLKVMEVIRQGQIGGGESHVLSLVKNFDPRNVSPIIMAFTPGQMIDSLTQQGIKCYVIETQKAFDFSVQKQIEQVIRQEGIQLIHAHGSRAASNLIWIAKKLKIPFVYTVHGWSFHPDQKWLIHQLRGWSEKLICAYAQEVICVSKSNWKTGQEVFGLNKGCVIENGIDLQRFNPHKTYTTLRETFDFAHDDFIVGFIARCTLQKDPLSYIKAVSIAHQKNPKIKGLLVGDGEMKEEVSTYILQEHLEKVIQTSPFRQDVPEILSMIQIYCLPSLWEGLSIALLEAMAMAKPLIVTPTDGTRELIRDKENGQIIPFNDPEALAKAILTYYDNPAFAIQCGQAAHIFVEKRFNAKRVSEQVTDIYLKILSPSCGTPHT